MLGRARRVLQAGPRQLRLMGGSIVRGGLPASSCVREARGGVRTDLPHRGVHSFVAAIHYMQAVGAARGRMGRGGCATPMECLPLNAACAWVRVHGCGYPCCLLLAAVRAEVVRAAQGGA